MQVSVSERAALFCKTVDRFMTCYALWPVCAIATYSPVYVFHGVAAILFLMLNILCMWRTISIFMKSWLGHQENRALNYLLYILLLTIYAIATSTLIPSDNLTGL